MTAPDRARLTEIREWARGATVYEGSDAQKVHVLLDALDEAEKALRRIASFESRYGASDEAIIARAALARIGTLSGEEDVEQAPLLDGAYEPKPGASPSKGSSSAESAARIGAE